MDIKLYEFDQLRDSRYGEILVFRQAHIDVYNTTGLNDCPAGLWDALDVEQLKKEYHAHKVVKNGPHFWMADSMSASFGEIATFGGLQARWAAKLNLRIAVKAAHGSVPYQIFTPKKTQKLVYSAGKPVFELIDPGGNAYVLQAHDEQFRMETLANLGEQMHKVPNGWQYRARTLTEDLVLDLGPGQTVYAVGDEFLQYYTRIPKADGPV
jgi:hypothetical protein